MKVLDLFSGIGGFSLGLERAGMETVAFCEFDKHAQKVLTKHWPNVPIFDDVRTLDGTQFRGTVDVICGGFPCQDLSTAGKQAGFKGERSSLYTHMLRIVSECMPRYAIFENVTGLISGDSGRWFARFLYDLDAIGYDAEWHCISASSIGAYHHRDRVWIVAYPQRERQPGQGRLKPSIYKKTDCFGEASGFINAFQKGAMPHVCRGHDGISGGMDRLKQLGNAVVPQIPEIIGKSIIEYESNKYK